MKTNYPKNLLFSRSSTVLMSILISWRKDMKPLKHYLILILLVIFYQPLSAQTSKDAAVQIDLTVDNSSHRLNFHLPSDPNAIWYQLCRRDLGSSTWGTPIITQLMGSTTQFFDTITPGKAYEYRVLK